MNNLGVQATIAGDMRRGEELHMESLRLATRFGDSANARFMRGNMIFVSFVRGRWEVRTGRCRGVHRASAKPVLHTPWSKLRAPREEMIRLARGDHDGALADHERMLALGRERQQAEGLVAGLAMLAVTQAELGMVEEARDLLGELVPLVRDHGVYARSAQAALFASPLDVPEDLRGAIVGSMGERATLWQNVIASALDGRPRAALPISSRRWDRRRTKLCFRFYAGARMFDAGRTERRRGRAREGARVLPLGRCDLLCRARRTAIG